MKICVKVIGYLIYQTGFEEKELELDGPVTVSELLARVNLEGKSPRLVSREGQALALDAALSDGDRIVIAPFYSGG